MACTRHGECCTFKYVAGWTDDRGSYLGCLSGTYALAWISLKMFCQRLVIFAAFFNSWRAIYQWKRQWLLHFKKKGIDIAIVLVTWLTQHWSIICYNYASWLSEYTRRSQNSTSVECAQCIQGHCGLAFIPCAYNTQIPATCIPLLT